MCLTMVNLREAGRNIGAFQTLVGAIVLDLDMVLMLIFLCVLSSK